MILTGESRSYGRKGGFFFKVAPNNPIGRGKSGIGAIELTFRYRAGQAGPVRAEGGH